MAAGADDRWESGRAATVVVSHESRARAWPLYSLAAIRTGIKLLGLSPFSCRKAVADNPLLRELVIPFGAAGYVVLYEIENPSTVTILAVRHQREEDYH